MLSLLLCVLLVGPAAAATAPAREPAPAVAEPTWGFDDGGIRVGLWPADGGPRGLIRVYAPFLQNPPGQVINFIAVEPIVGGRRSFSELERSAIDGMPGKQMWAVDELPRDWATWTPPRHPPRGREITIDGRGALTFFIIVEPLDNGARPVLQVILRRDRPREVTLRVDAAPGSAPMEACVLTATMGNYARLRRVQLKSRIVHAAELWPAFDTIHPHGPGFTPHAQWSVEDMLVDGGVAHVSATPDEPDPAAARFAPGTPAWWRYRGRRAAQYWRAPATKDLVVRVNARRAYWGSRIEIPGGIAFENFEMQAPFEPGQWFTFGLRELSKS